MESTLQKGSLRQCLLERDSVKEIVGYCGLQTTRTVNIEIYGVVRFLICCLRCVETANLDRQ